MQSRIFKDRRDAGRVLAPEIEALGLEEPIVLGLPRGGIPVAYEIALAIDAPLDVLAVRKLGVPFQPELALGAIASGGIRVLNEELLAEIPELDAAGIEEIAAREQAELERRETLYRGERPYPELGGRAVILVDDGMATGASMRAAVRAVRTREPATVVVAVPVAAVQAVRLVEEAADDVVCLDAPPRFAAVGYYYLDFGQTTDDEVRQLLEEAWRARPAA